MSIIWFWYRMSKNPSVVDVGWASGLTLNGLIYLSQHSLSPRTAIYGSALLIWGLRLGGYLWWTRISHKKIDRRYTILSQASHIKTPLYFFINFHLQGLFIFITHVTHINL
ncbi:DUF1295 domain-containing protein [Legionella sp. km772]|uniref:DUF1295 domain-containing protein n=1 Tax=Legionella sp. km772 TaxID=2498111 RepID=UPI002100B7C6|nr:DUF1295 domain-containing protein [Legionella sp. km772]